MAFRFPLQAVFHFRQSIEHQQESRLRAANQAVAKIRYLIDGVDARIREIQVGAARELAAGTTAAELYFAHTAETSLQAQRFDLARELTRLQLLRDQQQQLFHQARRERETLESLRNQQMRAYQQQQARREQRQVDDAFLSRLSYFKRGSKLPE